MGIQKLLGGFHIIDPDDHIGFLRTGTGEGIHIFNIDIGFVEDGQDGIEGAAAVTHLGGQYFRFGIEVLFTQEFADKVGADAFTADAASAAKKAKELVA